MPSARLTQRFVEATNPLPEGKSKVDYFDTQLPGLLLKVLASGRKTYYIRYRNPHGRRAELKLAHASVLSVAEARQLAAERLAALTRGQDPAENAPHRTTQPPTLEAFVQEHYLPYIQQHKRSWYTDATLLRTHALPRWGQQPISALRRADLDALIQSLLADHKPASINRLVVVLRHLFNLARAWEIPGVQANPTQGIGLLRENNQRDRYLTHADLQRLFTEIDRRPNPMLRPIITMLVLTGARRSEVLQARWEQIDLKRRLWRIPEPKSGRTRYVPISETLSKMLERLGTQDSPWLFPNPRTGRPFRNINDTWATLRRRAGLPEVRIHDLRHSYASFLINAGHSLYEVQKLLGHSQIKTTQRYAHLSQERLLEASNHVGQVLDAVTTGLDPE